MQNEPRDDAVAYESWSLLLNINGHIWLMFQPSQVDGSQATIAAQESPKLVKLVAG